MNGAVVFDRDLSLTVDKTLIETEVSSPAEPDLPDMADEANRTDIGNSRYLVALRGRDLRYVRGPGWMCWDGRRFAGDETGEVMRRAKATTEAMLKSSMELRDKSEREAAIKHSLRSMSDPRLRAMVKQAASEPGVAVRQDDLDKDRWVLNVENGTIDLRTGKLRPHRRADLITKLASVLYVKAATCPQFMTFLNRIMDNRQDLIGFLQRAVGYALTGDMSEQCLFILFGSGANGKSTLLRLLLDLMGDYGRQGPSSMLLSSRNDQHPTSVAGLRGSRLVSLIEADEGRHLAEGLVKQLSGGDRVSARLMKQDFSEFDPTFKLWFAVNHRPEIKGTDSAIWRRIRLIPFEIMIPPEEQDKHLLEKLRDELPGILQWAIEGCLKWQESGLEPPAEVTDATDRYRNDMDVIGPFLDDCTIRNPAMRVKKGEMFDAHLEWAKKTGEQPLSKRALGDRLLERGVQEDRNHRGRWWLRIGLRSNLDERDGDTA